MGQILTNRTGRENTNSRRKPEIKITAKQEGQFCLGFGNKFRSCCKLKTIELQYKLMKKMVAKNPLICTQEPKKLGTN